jgi:hypothetical protein
MNKVLAYTLLVLFSAIILSACILIIICPQILLTYQFRAIRFPDHPESNYCVLYMVIAAILYAAGYGGFYLLTKYNANSYLTQKYGYSNIVALGFVLQLVMGILFCVSLFGGLKGLIELNILVILLLFSPFIIRKLIQMTARDRSHDDFLLENPNDR